MNTNTLWGTALMAFMLLHSFFVNAQFQSTYTHNLDHDHYSCAHKFDSTGVVYAGSIFQGGNWQIHLMEVDQSGTVLNETVVGSTADEKVLHINRGINGNGYVISGQRKEGVFDVGFVMVISNSLAVVNQKRVALPTVTQHSPALHVISTTDNPCNNDLVPGYVACGFLADGYNSSDSKTAYIVKLDLNLNVLWQKFFDSPLGSNPNDWDMASSVVQACAVTGYFVGGSGTATDGDQAVLAAMVDYNGVLQWKKLYEGNNLTGETIVSADAAHDDAGSIRAIYQLVNKSDQRDMAIIKMDDQTGNFDLSVSKTLTAPSGDYYAYTFEAICNASILSIAGYALNKTITTGSTTSTGTFPFIFHYDVISSTVLASAQYPRQSTNYTPSTNIIDTYSTPTHPRIYYPKMMVRTRPPAMPIHYVVGYDDSGVLDELHLTTADGVMQSPCYFVSNQILISPFLPVISPVDTVLRVLNTSALALPNTPISSVAPGCTTPCPSNAQFQTIDNGNCCYTFIDLTLDGPGSPCNIWTITDMSNNAVGGGIGDTLNFCFNSLPAGTYSVCYRDCFQPPGVTRCWDDYCDTLTIACQPCSPSAADFGFVVNGCSVSFTDLTPEGNPNGCEYWVFGINGTSFSTDVASFTFPGTGTYTVCHYDCCVDPISGQIYYSNVCKTVSVVCPPPCCAPTDFQIFASGCCRTFIPTLPSNCNASNLIFVWSFGNNTTSNQQNPTACYAGSGAYTVCLKVFCNGALITTICKRIRVKCAIINPNPWGWNPNITASISGLQVQFTDATPQIAGYQLISREWSLGDGSSSTQQVVNHYYSNAGEKEVSLTVSLLNLLEGTIEQKSVTQTFFVNLLVPCNCGPPELLAFSPTDKLCGSTNSAMLSVHHTFQAANLKYEWFDITCNDGACDLFDLLVAITPDDLVGVGQQVWINDLSESHSYICKCTCISSGLTTYSNVVSLEYAPITVEILPTASSYCSGSTAVLTANSPGATSYSWFPSGSTNSSIQWITSNSTSVDLVVSNAAGCAAYDEIFVPVSPCVANDHRSNATLITGSLYPACNSFSANLTNATVSPEALSSVVLGGGKDVWYRFVAQSNGVRIQASSSTSDILIELQDASGTSMLASENETSSGQEILVFGNLVVGQTYFFTLRGNQVNSNGTVTCCCQHLRASQPDNGLNFSSLCGFLKARWNACSSYTITLSNGPNVYSATSSGTQFPFGLFNGLQYATTYNTVFTCLYNLPDAAGNVTQVSVVSPNYSIGIGSPPIAQLRSIDRCPTTRVLSSFIATDINVCGAQGWQWEFLEVSANDLPVGASAMIVNVNNPSRFIQLSSVPGIGPGEFYRVRVRPVFSSSTGQISSEYQLLCIAAAAGMPSISKSLITEEVTSAQMLFPNPNSGEFFYLTPDLGNIQITVFDMLGKLVEQNNYTVESRSPLMIRPRQTLTSGVYSIEVKFGYKSETFKMIVN